MVQDLINEINKRMLMKTNQRQCVPIIHCQMVNSNFNLLFIVLIFMLIIYQFKCELCILYEPNGSPSISFVSSVPFSVQHCSMLCMACVCVCTMYMYSIRPFIRRNNDFRKVQLTENKCLKKTQHGGSAKRDLLCPSGQYSMFNIR